MYRLTLLALVSGVAVAGCGGGAGSDADDSPTAEPRTIEITMTDNAYSPAELDVAAGETVRFVFRNDGSVRHEAVVGSLSEQEAHHAEMAEMSGSHDAGDHDGMDMGSTTHDEMAELHAVVVEPGETVEMTHTFEEDGPTMIGCHEPGHWESGMKMQIDV